MGQIVFNTTYHVHRTTAKAWQAFMQQHYKPRVEACSDFSDYRVCQILLEDESTDMAFAVQFSATTREVVEQWIAKDGHLINAYLQKKFGDKVLSFSTFMQIVE